jgi:hypothetical protein
MKKKEKEPVRYSYNLDADCVYRFEEKDGKVLAWRKSRDGKEVQVNFSESDWARECYYEIGWTDRITKEQYDTFRELEKGNKDQI